MPVIGIDDTDSSTEMCTTYLTIEILRQTNLDLIGLPRLVRLNPNIPLKTRGNAAISLTLGRGKGEKMAVGKIGNEDIFSYLDFDEEMIDVDIMSIIEKFSPKDENTNPALLVTESPNDENFYWDAVREFVDYRKVREKARGKFSTVNGEIGIVGANAAVSWPRKNITYELIAYLERDRWRGNHFVDPEGSKFIELNFPDTFDSFDLRHGYNAIRPTTKTPVLFGIRGVNMRNLMSYLDYVKSEPYFSFIVFETNQGTDDHLQERKIEDIRLYHSSIIHGFVSSNPRTLKGGVVDVEIASENARISAVAMEPTKEFRDTILKLKKGDEVRIYGGTTKEGVINIEKMQVVSLSTVREVGPPVCPNCGTRMESSGSGKGFRCRKCGKRSMKGEERISERDLKEGFYEVPVIARRHLARPLKLGLVK